MTTKPTTSLPRTERPDAPAYLTRHLSRQAVPFRGAGTCPAQGRRPPA